MIDYNNLYNLKKLVNWQKCKDKDTSLQTLNTSVQSYIHAKQYSTIIYQKKFPKIFNRNSDTVFILGSGPEINNISDKEWVVINKNDSIGFNFWLCHDHVPTHYIFQSPKNIILNELATKILSKKKPYEKVKFYIRGDEVNYNRFHKSLAGKFLLSSQCYEKSFLPELFIHSKCKISPLDHIKQLDDYGYLNKSNGLQIPKFGSTIGLILPLALMCGYKKIIMCGIDMNDGSHFFDDSKYQNLYPELKNIYKNFTNEKIHPHQDRNIRKFTIKDVITAFEYYFRVIHGTLLYTGSKNSSLYPEIPLYFN